MVVSSRAEVDPGSRSNREVTGVDERGSRDALNASLRTLPPNYADRRVVSSNEGICDSSVLEVTMPAFRQVGQEKHLTRLCCSLHWRK